MNNIQRGLMVAIMALVAQVAQAGQYWWAGDGVSLGGNGPWNTVSNNWRDGSATGSFTAWHNGGSDEAVFTNTSGTVTLGTNVNLNAMTFTANNAMTFNSGTLNFGSGAATLSISNDANVTLNSALAGSGTLTLKTTKNTWQRGFYLYGNNSGFTGKLVVQLTAGSYFWLYATNDFNFGAVPAVYTADALTFNGVNFQTASGITLNISTNRGITLGSGGVSFYNGALGTINFNSIITGSGAPTFDASTGVINLNNVNSYSGTLSLYGGKTMINMDNALPHGAGKGDVWFRCWNSAVTLDLNGHVVTINAMYDQGGTYSPSSCIDNSAAGSATLIVGDGNAGNTFPRFIKNTGGALSVTKIGTGTQALSGPCTYTGATTVNGGTLTISGTNSASSGMAVNNGGTLVISGFLSNAVPLTVNAGGTLQADLSVNTNGVFNSASGVTLAGGTLNIKGKNSGTSATALGNLTVNPAGSTVSLTSNGGSGTALTLGNTWTRQVSGTLLVDVSAAGSTVTSSPTLTNGIIGGYAFVKDGTGTGFASVSGGTVVRYTGATLLDATAAASDLNGSLNYIAAAGVTLTGSSVTQTVHSIGASGGFSSGAKTLLVGSGGVLLQGTSWFGFSGTITSPTGELIVYSTNNGSPDLYAKVTDYGTQKVDLIKAGSGAIRLGASSHTYTGNTIVNGGWLGRASEIPYGAGKGNLVVNLGGTVDLEGGNLNVNGLTQSAGNTGGSVTTANYGGTLAKLTVGYADTSATFSGVISDSGAAVSLALIKVGTGTLTLSGANTYRGGTTLSNGVLSVSSTNNIGGANAAVTFAGGTLRINGTTFNSFGATPLTFTGAGGGLDIADAGNAVTLTNNLGSGTVLTKTGAGTLSLTGTQAGTINTDDPSRISFGSGLGFYNLGVTTSGVLSPAGSGTIGTVAVNNDLTLAGKLLMDVTASTNDTVTAGGSITLSAGATLELVNPSLLNRSKQYQIMTAGGSVSGSLTALNLPDRWKVSAVGNKVILYYAFRGTMIRIF